MVIRQTDYDEKGVLRLAAVCVNGERPGDCYALELRDDATFFLALAKRLRYRCAARATCRWSLDTSASDGSERRRHGVLP